MPDCPTDDLVAQFVNGDLSVDTAAAVRRHLDGCSVCLRLIEELGAVAATGRVSDNAVSPIATTAPSREDNAIADRSGSSLGRYALVRPLGAGGMGVVYEALDSKLRRTVALKVLRVSDAGGGQEKQLAARMLIEAQAMAKLQHPNVVAVHDVGDIASEVFVAMELVDGGTLRAWLASERRDWRAIVAKYIEAGRGLAAAHRAGIVHRDFKPENVLLTRGGVARVADFGLARWAEAVAEGTASTRSPGGDVGLTPELTKHGAILGTPSYMAPEQFRGERATAQSDIFSFCAALYESLYGRLAFEGKTFGELRANVLAGRRTLPPRGARVPAAVAQVLRKGLSVDLADRYLTMDATLDALERARAKAPRARTTAIAAFGVVAAGAIALGAFTSLNRARGDVHVSTGRRTVAVLGFTSASARPEESWVSTALEEMIAAELAGGRQLRVLSGDEVAKLRRDLGITDPQALDRESLARLRRAAGIDVIVTGKNALAGDDLRVDVDIRDGTAGESLGHASVKRAARDLSDLATQVGARLREQLGVPALDAEGSEAVRAAVPANAEAARLYVTGLQKVRAFDHLGARAALEQANAIDPSSARAQSALAEVLVWFGNQAPAAEHAKRAFELSAPLEKIERVRLEAAYQALTGDHARGIELLRALWTLYPDDVVIGESLATAQIKGKKFADAAEVLRRLRAQPAASCDELSLDLLELDAAYGLDDLAATKIIAERTLSEANARGAREAMAHAKRRQGLVLRDLGDHAAAGVAFDDAARLFAAYGNVVGEAFALDARATILADAGDLDGATRLLERASALAHQAGNVDAESDVLADSAVVRELKGDLVGAKRITEAVLAIERADQRKNGIETTLNNVGVFAIELGELADAKRACDESVAMAKAFPAARASAEALACAGNVARLGGDASAAETSVNAARVTAAASHIVLTGASQTLAELRLEGGRAKDAEAIARSMREEAHAANKARAEAVASSLLARALAEQGKAKEAREAVATASEAHLPPDERAELSINSAKALGRLGATADVAEARRLLEEVSSRTGDYVTTRLDARITLAELEAARGDRAAALARLQKLQGDPALAKIPLFARRVARAQERLGVRASKP